MAIEFNNLISSRQRGATTTIGLVWYSPASKNRIRGPDLKKFEMESGAFTIFFARRKADILKTYMRQV
jgi:hypothetical protein